MVFTKFITAVVCLFAFTLDVSAMGCLKDIDNPGKNTGDEPFLDGNVIFVGVVTDLNFEQKFDKISCMSVDYKPSEMLFGSKSDSFDFKVCGPDIPRSSVSKEFKMWSEFFGVGIGNEQIVGLTKRPLPSARQDHNFESDFRYIYIDCLPVLIWLDPASEDERKRFLDETREQIRKRASE